MTPLRDTQTQSIFQTLLCTQTAKLSAALGAVLLALGGCGAPDAVADGPLPWRSSETAHSALRAKDRADGLVTAHELRGCTLGGYTAKVQVDGDDIFDLLVDTAAGTTGIAANTCINCNLERGFHQQSLRLHHSVSSYYANQTGWQGSIYSAKFSIVGAQQSTPAIATRFASIQRQRGRQDFFAAMGCEEEGLKSSLHGLLALGPSTLLEPYTDNFVDNLVAKETSLRDQFAFRLCDFGGTMYFGGYDQSLMLSALKDRDSSGAFANLSE